MRAPVHMEPMLSMSISFFASLDTLPCFSLPCTCTAYQHITSRTGLRCTCTRHHAQPCASLSQPVYFC